MRTLPARSLYLERPMTKAMRLFVFAAVACVGMTLGATFQTLEAAPRSHCCGDPPDGYDCVLTNYSCGGTTEECVWFCYY